jgi:hypothetical protein
VQGLALDISPPPGILRRAVSIRDTWCSG